MWCGAKCAANPIDASDHEQLIHLGFKGICMLSSAHTQACFWCGVTGPPHGSDADCIAALRARVAQLDNFVDSLVKQSGRRHQLSIDRETDHRPPTPIKQTA